MYSGWVGGGSGGRALASQERTAKPSLGLSGPRNQAAPAQSFLPRPGGRMGSQPGGGGPTLADQEPGQQFRAQRSASISPTLTDTPSRRCTTG